MKLTYQDPTPITPIMQRFALAAVLLMVITVILSGCLFFNSAPIARFSASVLTGTAPLFVSFDASNSYDPDGTIFSYHWDFGDGSTATGITTSHTFTTTTTFTITLTVTDDAGATGTSTQSIELLLAGSSGSNPPTARFTAKPSYGNSPLTIVFDASLSSAVDGTIAVYAWDFGDGATGSGKTISHTFIAAATTNFTVTLTVTDNSGSAANTSLVITAMVPVVVPTDGPTASFTASDPITVYASDSLPGTPSLFEVTFDPALSTPAPGHTLKTFLWNFGDGDTLSLSTNASVKHTYASGSPSHTFVVTLTVIDEQGLTDSAVRNVTVTN
jgi:PKD repeat protein